MPSEMKVNKISPASGTSITLGDSGDTFTIPSGATITNSGTQNGFGSTSASDLSSGTLPMARLSGTLPALNGSALTALNATQLTSGTIPIARIADDAVTNAKMADDAIDSAQIADGAVDLAHMSSQSVDEDNLHISNAGTNGQFLSKQSGNTGGLTWADAGGGKVLQVVSQTLNSQTSTSATSFAATPYYVNITPSATSSKVYVMWTSPKCYQNTANLGFYHRTTIYRDSTNIGSYNGFNGYYINGVTYDDIGYNMTASVLDSPNTTSQVTYKIYQKVNNAGAAAYMSFDTDSSTITAFEIGV